MKAIIERGTDGGFAIYAEEVSGAFGSGETEQEAKNDFVEVLEEQAEYYQEQTGNLPDWYNGGKYTIEYVYDLSAFFEQFPFINATEFAKAIGLNASLMRKYKRKIVPISDKQKARIQSNYNAILNRMQAVTF
ncbi:MAG: type II toxin-antitoxin system HicB family antitoxin [Bacteroidales bacterium]|nr:type II toxin-antitoxin system HicB family antitoxin [Bacteroidales bacterium]